MIDAPRALAALDRALAARPDRDDAAFIETTNALCAERDRMIADRRAGHGRPEQLDHINAIISGALAGHFPLGRLPWPEIERTRAALADLIASA